MTVNAALMAVAMLITAGLACVLLYALVRSVVGWLKAMKGR